jgi:hypothetical protein
MWWTLCDYQTTLVAHLTTQVLKHLTMFSTLYSDTEYQRVIFRVSDTDGRSLLPVNMDALAPLRGLPIYLALMLSVPDRVVRGGQIFIGILAIMFVAITGFTIEAAARLAAALSDVGVDVIPFRYISTPAMTMAAFVQVLTKAISTRVLPIGLWLWQQWHFVRSLVA